MQNGVCTLLCVFWCFHPAELPTAGEAPCSSAGLLPLPVSEASTTSTYTPQVCTEQRASSLFSLSLKLEYLQVPAVAYSPWKWDAHCTGNDLCIFSSLSLSCAHEVDMIDHHSQLFMKRISQTTHITPSVRLCRFNSKRLPA